MPRIKFVSVIVLLVISFSMIIFFGLNGYVQAQDFQNTVMESEHYKIIILNITPG